MANLAKAEEIYARLSAYTIIPQERFVLNICYAMDLLTDTSFPNGFIVECGVWRGGMSAGFLDVFGTSRDYKFFDSFMGLPPPTANDGQDVMWWAKHPEHPRYFNNCRASSGSLKKLINGKISTDSIVEGWFADTLPKAKLSNIAFLHLDCDWYDSYTTCLEHLWDSVQPGGVIIFDDYYDWEGARRAVHDFLSRKKARESIQRIGSSGGVLIRRLGEKWNIKESPHLW